MALGDEDLRFARIRAERDEQNTLRAASLRERARYVRGREVPEGLHDVAFVGGIPRTQLRTLSAAPELVDEAAETVRWQRFVERAPRTAEWLADVPERAGMDEAALERLAEIEESLDRSAHPFDLSELMSTGAGLGWHDVRAVVPIVRLARGYTDVDSAAEAWSQRFARLQELQGDESPLVRQTREALEEPLGALDDSVAGWFATAFGGDDARAERLDTIKSFLVSSGAQASEFTGPVLAWLIASESDIYTSDSASALATVGRKLRDIAGTALSQRDRGLSFAVQESTRSLVSSFPSLIGAGVGLLGGGAGVGVGTGVGSALSEFTAYIEGEIASSGVDQANPAALAELFRDEVFMSRIIAESERRAVVMGAIEGLSGALAGRHLAGAARRAAPSRAAAGAVAGAASRETIGGTLARSARRVASPGLELLEGAVIEGAGEGLGGLAATGELSPSDILLESALGTFTSTAQSAIGVQKHVRPSTARSLVGRLAAARAANASADEMAESADAAIQAGADPAEVSDVIDSLVRAGSSAVASVVDVPVTAFDEAAAAAGVEPLALARDLLAHGEGSYASARADGWIPVSVGSLLALPVESRESVVGPLRGALIDQVDWVGAGDVETLEVEAAALVEAEQGATLTDEDTAEADVAAERERLGRLLELLNQAEEASAPIDIVDQAERRVRGDDASSTLQQPARDPSEFDRQPDELQQTRDFPETDGGFPASAPLSDVQGNDEDASGGAVVDDEVLATADPTTPEGALAVRRAVARTRRRLAALEAERPVTDDDTLEAEQERLTGEFRRGQVRKSKATLGAFHVTNALRVFAERTGIKVADILRAAPLTVSRGRRAKPKPVKATPGAERLPSSQRPVPATVTVEPRRALDEATEISSERAGVVIAGLGDDVSIKVPGRRYAARYGVMELDALIASHRPRDASGRSYVERSEYPDGLQPRPYHRSPQEAAKVDRFATDLAENVDLFMGPSSTPTDGTPIVTPDGVVVNGNGRAMALQLARRLGHFKAYRDRVGEAASALGVDMESLAGMRDPVLVRVVDMDGDSADAREFARLGNIPLTQQQAPTDRLDALAKALPDEAFRLNVPDGATLGDILSQRTAATVGVLDQLHDALPAELRPAIFADDLTLTSQGRDDVVHLLRDRFLPTADYARSTGIIQQALDRAITPITQVRGRLIDAFAVDAALAEAVRFGVGTLQNWRDPIEQGALGFGPDPLADMSPLAREIVRVMVAGKTRPTTLARALVKYVAIAETQTMMGRAIMSADEVMARAARAVADEDAAKTVKQAHRVPGEPRMVATHGLSLRKLQLGLQLGGLAVPSFAVTAEGDVRADQHYGKIKLIGHRGLVDPASGVPVFDRDAWTAVFPAPSYKAVPKRRLAVLERVLDPVAVEFGDTGLDDEVQKYTRRVPDRGELLTVIASSVTGHALVARAHGLTVEPVTVRGQRPDSLEAARLLRLQLDEAGISREAIRDHIDAEVIGDELFEAPRLLVGSRRLPYTLENVVRVMTREKGDARGRAEGSGIRAATARRLSSLTAMREAVAKTEPSLEVREASAENARSAKQEAVEAVERVLNTALGPASGFEVFRGAHLVDAAVTVALDDGRLGRALDDGVSVRDALVRAVEEVSPRDVRVPSDDGVIDALVEYVTLVSEMPAAYLEAKVMGATRFEDFAGAVLPVDEAFNEVAGELATRGVEVFRYVDEGALSTANAERSAISKLSQRRDDVLFDGDVQYLVGEGDDARVPDDVERPALDEQKPTAAGQLSLFESQGARRPPPTDDIAKLLRGELGVASFTMKAGDSVSALAAGVVQGDLFEMIPMAGLVLRTNRDVAAAMALYRSPFAERLTWVVTDADGNVKANALHSVGTRTMALAMTDEDVGEMLKRARYAEGDRVYWVHNHPSGNPRPSRPDLAVHDRIARLVQQHATDRGFQGTPVVNGLVLDHDRFGVLTTAPSPFGDGTETDVQFETARIADPFWVAQDRVAFQSPHDVASFVKSLATSDGSAYVIHVDGGNRVVGVEAFKSAPPLSEIRARRELHAGVRSFVASKQDSVGDALARQYHVANDVLDHIELYEDGQARQAVQGRPHLSNTSQSVVEASHFRHPDDDRVFEGTGVVRMIAESPGPDDVGDEDTVLVEGLGPRPTMTNHGRLIATTPDALRNFWRMYEGAPVDEHGRPIEMYHGARRADRIGNQFQKNRATLGPMSFFTVDRDVANGYATSKADTSIEPGSYEQWFSYLPHGSRVPVTLDRLWSHLSTEERRNVRERFMRVVVDDPETAEPLAKAMVLPEGETALTDRGHWDYVMTREVRGDPIRAMVDVHLTSGTMFGDERRFGDLLVAAGLDPKRLRFTSPFLELPGVVPVFLNVKNPLNTRTLESDHPVVEALRKQARRQPLPEFDLGADLWDKSTRDPNVWVNQLNEDIEGGTGGAWTSIPDWVTRVLKKHGFDAIVDPLGAQDTAVYIPFEPQQVFSSIGNRGTFDETSRSIVREEPDTLQQGDEDGADDPRGEITVPGPVDPYGSATRVFDMRLWETADPTTLYHEASHYLLEVMTGMANAAPESSVALDLDTALVEIGVPGETVEARRAAWESRFERTASGGFALTEEGRQWHEAWAGSYETWLETGKAPSEKLRAMFALVRAWFMRTYERLQGSGATVSPRLVEVFERLHATDEEIAETRDAQGARQLFGSMEEAGMSPDQWAEYVEAQQAVTDRATSDMDADMLRFLSAETRAVRRRRREEIKPNVEREVEARRPVRVMRWLRGEVELEGVDVPEGLAGRKLDAGSLVELLGRSSIELKTLRGMKLVAPEGEPGLSVQLAAELFDLGSGSDLVGALVQLVNLKETKAALVEFQLTAENPDLMLDPRGRRARAERALRENQTRATRAELSRLRETVLGGVEAVRAVPADRVIRSVVRRELEGRAIGRVNARRYAGRARRAAARGLKAFKSGDIAAAARWKERELYDLHRASVAWEIEQRREQLYKLMRSASTQASLGRVGKMSPTHRDIIIDILTMLRVRRETVAKTERGQRLRAWLKSQEQEGLPLDVPVDALELAATRNISELNVVDLEAVWQGIRAIQERAAFKQRLIDKREKVRFDNLRVSIVDALKRSKRGRKVSVERRQREASAHKTIDHVVAGMRKLGNMVREMGDGEHGALWSVTSRLFNRADGEAQERMRAAHQRMREIREKFLTDEETKANVMTRREAVPALAAREDIDERSMSLEQKLAVLLNMGNAENRQRLSNTYSNKEIAGIISTLEARHLQFAQAVWDHVESFWGDVSRQYERINGVAPVKVEATAFRVDLPSGDSVDLRGGYYPINYDDVRQHQRDEAEVWSDMQRGEAARSMTRNGHTKTRMAKVTGRGLSLTLDVYTSHVHDVIHDLTHREAVLSANQVLGDPKVQTAIVDYYGREQYTAMLHAVRDVATKSHRQQQFLGQIMRYVRFGTTVKTLALNVQTTLLQLTGLGVSIAQLGVMAVTRASSNVYASRAARREWREFIYENSLVMKNRSATWNREVAEMQSRSDFKRSARARFMEKIVGNAERLAKMESLYFSTIAATQHEVDVVTWVAAYETEMGKTADHQRAVDIADQVVIDTQVSGSTKDLSAFQRENEAFKLFNLYVSFHAAMFNLTYDRVSAVRNGRIGKLPFIREMLVLSTLPAAMSAVMMVSLSAARGEEPDEEDLIDRFGREVLGQAVGQLPLGSVFSGAARFGRIEVAGLELVLDASRLAGRVPEMLDEGVTARDLKQLNEIGGTLLMYPANQMNRMVDGTYDWLNGNAPATSVIFGGPR